MSTYHRLYLLFSLLVCFAAPVQAQHPVSRIDSLERALPNMKEDTNKVHAYYQLVQLWNENDASKALYYADAMMRLSDSIGYKGGKARALNSYGNTYMAQGNYQQSLSALLQSLRIYESLYDTIGMAAIYNCLGTLYNALSKHDQSLKYYDQSIFFYKRVGGDYGKIRIPYINKAGVYLQLRQPQKALVYYQKAVAESQNDAGLCLNIASAFSELGDQDSALAYLNKSKEYPYQPRILAFSELMLGNVYLRRHQPSEALQHLEISLDVAQHNGFNYILPEIYKNMSEAYEGKGLEKEALRYYKLFHSIDDTIQGSDKMRKMLELQSAYDLEKKDHEIESLDNAKKMAELQSGKDRLSRNSFVIAFVLMSLLSLAFVRNAYLKQKVNRILNEKNKQIEQQKVEIEKVNLALDQYNKEILKDNVIAKYEILKTKTNPHFLFNSLTSLSALVIRDKESALEFIGRFSQLYRMILEMADNRLISLKQEMELVNNYLYLEKARFRENLIVNVNIDESLHAMQLPSFAVQICVENALKHNIISDKRKLTISIYCENGQVVIRNNLQRKISEIISTSTGQKNIIERYRLLSDKKVEFIQTETEYLVNLPLLSQEHRL